MAEKQSPFEKVASGLKATWNSVASLVTEYRVGNLGREIRQKTVAIERASKKNQTEKVAELSAKKQALAAKRKRLAQAMRN